MGGAFSGELEDLDDFILGGSFDGVNLIEVRFIIDAVLEDFGGTFDDFEVTFEGHGESTLGEVGGGLGVFVEPIIESMEVGFHLVELFHVVCGDAIGGTGQEGGDSEGFDFCGVDWEAAHCAYTLYPDCLLCLAQMVEDESM